MLHPVQLILFGIPLLSLLWWWWADRRLRGLGWGVRFALALPVLAMLAGFFWVVLVRRELVTTPIPASWYALVLLWGLIFLPLLAVPSMFGWSLWTLFGKIFNRSGVPKNAVVDVAWSRRRWIRTLGTMLPVLGTYGVTAASIPLMTRFRVREMTVSLADLPDALDGMRIAHVTDTHVGKFTRGDVLDEIVAATNALDADLVLFTGDLIDNTIRDLPMAVGMMQRLRGKSGVFLIEGNHDLFDDPSGFERMVREGGISMLRNEAATVQVRGGAVQLLGIVWKRRETEMAADVDTVADLRDPAAFPILLAHHPHAFDRAAERGISLTLAGHTHGGQLMLNRHVGAGPSMYRYWSGLYETAGRALVVGNGTGNWFPVRINAPAEIIHLTLRRA
ncbi:MAG: metallophosphoesterase [Luteolibacter sp.]